MLTLTLQNKVDRHKDLKEIAKEVRQDIKKVMPEIKVSVTIKRYSMGQSLTISVTDCPLDIFTQNYKEYMKEGSWDSYWDWQEKKGLVAQARHTAQAEAVLKNLSEIAGQYRYDNSDSQTDYFDTNFYLTVEFSYFLEKRKAELC